MRRAKLIHYVYAGRIERSRSMNGRPGYVLRDGYSRTDASAGRNLHYPWVTKREALKEAKAEGGKAVFHYGTVDAKQNTV